MRSGDCARIALLGLIACGARSELALGPAADEGAPLPPEGAAPRDADAADDGSNGSDAPSSVPCDPPPPVPAPSCPQALCGNGSVTVAAGPALTSLGLAAQGGDAIVAYGDTLRVVLERIDVSP